jgi:hypothetical protein
MKRRFSQAKEKLDFVGRVSVATIGISERTRGAELAPSRIQSAIDVDRCIFTGMKKDSRGPERVLQRGNED